MKNKVIGVLIFLFFVVVAYLFENGDIARLFVISPALIVFCPAAGLSVAYYKKGTDRQSLLRRLRKYLIGCGLIGTLLGLISVFGASEAAVSSAIILKKVSSCLIPTFYGLISSYIVDTFVD